MTNAHILIIHKYQTLFNILNEVKSILNFDLKLVNDNKFDEGDSKRNLVIISGENKFHKKNQLKIDDLPININKFIEIVNIQFLKNKFSEQNNIKIGKYSINLNSRKMSFKNKSLSLTEKETKIITYLNNLKKAVTIERLQSEVWDHKLKLETHTVETHIYRLRKKVEKKFEDKSFILSFKNGYKIKI